MGDDQRSDMMASLRRLGLVAPGETPEMIALTGGVSSDIWRVDLATGPVCVKRALARLQVAEVWEAPVERNGNEAEWMRVVTKRVPGCSPRIIAEDREANLFVMEFLEPANHPVWKERLKEGETDSEFATAVGSTIARIHSLTAGDQTLARRFGSNDMFFALRLEPYFLASARHHRDLAGVLEDLVERTANTKVALVHGDVSPKNILVGPSGPVLLDAECAWYGDPGFDLAFCLCHMLLKCLWVPDAADGFLDCYGSLAAAYKDGIDWEPADAHERRTAVLLAAMVLARIDGKSPVEYLTDEKVKQRARSVACALLERSQLNLESIADVWRREMVS
jgi:aminoglycoside phosphotransferase (APT) family kinase protein